MFTDFIATTLTTATDIIEGVMLAVVGVKPSRRTRKLAMRQQHRTKRQARKLVLNERAQLRLAGKLLRELPRDEALSVLNTIQQYAK